jgi:hypothetical protein
MGDSLGTILWGTFVRLFGKQLYFSVYRLTGVRLTSDTHYVDWEQITAVFPASTEKVQELLPSSKLKPVEISPGKTGIYVAGNHFRKIRSLAPYEEFAVGVQVNYQGSNEHETMPHYYLITLPVSTEAARWGGAHLLGMPKFVAPIQHEDQGDRVTCTVKVDDADYLRLEVPKLTTQPAVSEKGYYGVRDGQLVRTRMSLEGMVGDCEGSPGAHFRLGSHPMADKFRALEIEDTSVSFSYMESGHSILFKPDLILPL